MGLYDSNSYLDLLRNLQTYSAQRRSSTGRGLTPQEIEAATRGYQDANQAKKVELYKTSMNNRAQAQLHNANIAQRKSEQAQQASQEAARMDLQRDQMSTQNQAATTKGWMSLPQYANQTMNTYRMAKGLLGTMFPDKAAPLVNATPSLSAPAYSAPAPVYTEGVPIGEGISQATSSSSTPLLSSLTTGYEPIASGVNPFTGGAITASPSLSSIGFAAPEAVSYGLDTATAAEPAFNMTAAAANGVAPVSEAATTTMSGMPWLTAALLARWGLGQTIDQPGGEPGSVGRDIGMGMQNMGDVWNAMMGVTESPDDVVNLSSDNGKTLADYWQFINQGSPLGELAWTDAGNDWWNISSWF